MNVAKYAVECLSRIWPVRFPIGRGSPRNEVPVLHSIEKLLTCRTLRREQRSLAYHPAARRRRYPLD
jgi:hypothetical protein